MSKKNYTKQIGLLWEETFFGFDNTKFPNRPALFSYDYSVSQAIRNQHKIGWNPLEPGTVISKHLYECIQSYLPENLSKKLEMYCTLGTGLDIYYGVDGFFRLGNAIVTFDLSTRDKSKLKADMLFLAEKCISFEMWKISLEVAHRLEENYKS